MCSDRAIEGAARAYTQVLQLPYAADDAISELAERVVKARRPMIWLGGGARGAGAEATELVRSRFRRGQLDQWPCCGLRRQSGNAWGVQHDA